MTTLFFCQIGCMNALLLRLWIYGSRADKIVLMNIWCGSTSVQFDLHV